MTSMGVIWLSFWPEVVVATPELVQPRSPRPPKAPEHAAGFGAIHNPLVFFIVLHHSHIEPIRARSDGVVQLFRTKQETTMKKLSRLLIVLTGAIALICGSAVVAPKVTGSTASA